MAGVVPPPVHGQSLATQLLFGSDLSPIAKHLVEIRSSARLDEIGKATPGKVFGLFGILFRALRARFHSGARVLYYCAGSAAMVPFARDVIVLGLLRPFFNRTVIHYHSGGLPEYLADCPLRAALGRWIYGRGAWAISLSKLTPVPGLAWGASREIEVPNGLDVGQFLPADPPAPADPAELRLLFIGNLFEDKGIFDLLAAAKLAARTSPFRLRLTLIGNWPDEATRLRFEQACLHLPPQLLLDDPGPRYGDEKWQALGGADLFLFPTFYRSENLPLVIIEAMAATLPVIATDWRGVGSLVEDGVTGQLVPPRDVDALADAIQRLAADPALRQSMAAAGRSRYEQRFTAAAHLQAMKAVLMEAAM